MYKLWQDLQDRSRVASERKRTQTVTTLEHTQSLAHFQRQEDGLHPHPLRHTMIWLRGNSMDVGTTKQTMTKT